MILHEADQIYTTNMNVLRCFHSSLNPLMRTAAKSSLTIWGNLSSKSMGKDIFKGEMFIRIPQPTLLEIVYKKCFFISKLLSKVSEIQTTISRVTLKQ